MNALIHDYFYLFGPLTLAVQIGLCIHAYRTGRPFWWMWIIFIAPWIGSLAYVAIEILPNLGSTGRRGMRISGWVPATVQIRRLRQELEEGDTVARRLNLAAALHHMGEKEEADAVASEAARGVFKGDPAVVAEVAWYKIEAGHVEGAQALLDGIDSKPDRMTAVNLNLLRARILAARGDSAGALKILEGLVDSSVGEERRYALALCHARLGQKAEALSVLEDIIRAYRRGGAIWRRAEKHWFQAAMKAKRDIEAGIVPGESDKAGQVTTEGVTASTKIR